MELCAIDGSDEDVQSVPIGERTVAMCLTDRVLLGNFQFEQLLSRRDRYRTRMETRARAEDLLGALLDFQDAEVPSGPTWTVVIQAAAALKTAAGL